MSNRVSKDTYYLSIADAVLERSTCLRRTYGSVIVNHDQIISTGYNGAPRGEENCIDRGSCERVRMHVPQGERYELCCAVHSEVNAIISASRQEMIGSTLYLAGRDTVTGDVIDARPCLMCSRVIRNAGISKVVCREKTEELFIIHVDDIEN